MFGGIFGCAENFPQPPDMPINGNTTQGALSDTWSCIRKQPASFRVSEETGLPSPSRKVIETRLTSERNRIKSFAGPSAEAHSRVNQSPGSWVPWGPAWSYLFTYFTLFVALSGIIITLPLFSPSFYPYCALLVVNFCFLCGVDGRTLSLVLGRLLWINCDVTSAFPAWVPFYSPRTCWAFAVMLHC